MTIRAGDILQRAAIVLNDEDFVRWPKTELFQWLNEAATEIVLRRPPAGARTVPVALAEGVLQSIPEDGVTLLDIPRNVGGVAVRRTDRQLLDDQRPNWPQMKPANAIKHYTFDERAPKIFYVYPPARAGVLVEMLYSAPPAVVADDEDLLMMDRVYEGPLLSYVLYRASTKDSEYANGGVAAAYFGAFSEAIGTNNQTTMVVSPNTSSV